MRRVVRFAGATRRFNSKEKRNLSIVRNGAPERRSQNRIYASREALLRRLIERLFAWQKHMGGFDAPVRREAERYLALGPSPEGDRGRASAEQSVIRMLDISTLHLGQDTCEALCAGRLAIAAVPWTRYGAICWVPEEGMLGEYAYLPQDLVHVLRYASSRGIAYVKFDCDANEHPDLATYQW